MTRGYLHTLAITAHPPARPPLDRSAQEPTTRPRPPAPMPSPLATGPHQGDLTKVTFPAGSWEGGVPVTEQTNLPALQCGRSGSPLCTVLGSARGCLSVAELLLPVMVMLGMLWGGQLLGWEGPWGMCCTIPASPSRAASAGPPEAPRRDGSTGCSLQRHLPFLFFL